MDGTENNLITNNMNDICRLCLQNRQSLIPIFSNTNLESFKIQLLIRDLCSIKLIEGDSFPKCICNDCKDKLYNIYDFISQCKESDSKLHKIQRTSSISVQTVDDAVFEEEENSSKCHRKNLGNQSVNTVNIKHEMLDDDTGFDTSPPITVSLENEMVIDDYEQKEKYIEEWQNHMSFTRNHIPSKVREDSNNEEIKPLMNEDIVRNVAFQQGCWNVQVILQGDEHCVNSEDEAEQLYGKDWLHEEMVLLQDDIYCRKSVYEMTLTASQKASHVARRLITGVFKPEAIKKCTLTGQTPRTLGRQRLNDKVDCLHVGARNAIINYSMSMANERGWKSQTVPELKHALSQRLGELKREMKYAEFQHQYCGNITM